MRFDGKVAIVTGSSQGIGKAIAMALAGLFNNIFRKFTLITAAVNNRLISC